MENSFQIHHFPTALSLQPWRWSRIAVLVKRSCQEGLKCRFWVMFAYTRASCMLTAVSALLEWLVPGWLYVGTACWCGYASVQGMMWGWIIDSSTEGSPALAPEHHKEHGKPIPRSCASQNSLFLRALLLSVAFWNSCISILFRLFRGILQSDSWGYLTKE